MKYFIALLLPCIMLTAGAQTTLPVIRANSKTVSIRDGAFFDKGQWTLSPSAKPDVYTADRTRQTKYVTFLTDIDSIRVKVTPGSRFDFIILYQGKDSCYSSIQSAIPPAGSISQAARPDTIPFTLTDYNAIAIKAIIDNRDTITIHFDLSGFGLRFTKTAILQKTNLLPNRADVLAGKAQPNYRKLNKVGTLQMGTLTLNSPTVAATDITAHDMDGRLGWDLFDGKVVELNYEKNLLVIHPHLPQNLKGYKRSRLQFIRSFPCATAALVIDGIKYAGNFLLDNGSEQSLIIDSLWAAQSNFPMNLSIMSTTVLHSPRGNSYTSHKVNIPLVRLNGFSSGPVPALMLGDQQPAGFSINFLGNGLLKHYDLIADFQHDELYLKPNSNI